MATRTVNEPFPPISRLNMSRTAGESKSIAPLCGNFMLFNAMQKPLVCARCKAASYCSKDCQVHTYTKYTGREASDGLVKCRWMMTF